MKAFRINSMSSFAYDGLRIKGVSQSVVKKNGDIRYQASCGQVFCLSDSFSGEVSFGGNDLFAVSVYFDGVSVKNIGSFGIPWDDCCKKFEELFGAETDDEPMVESEWFEKLCEEFVKWVCSHF